MKKITVLLIYLIVASVSAQEMFYNVLDYGIYFRYVKGLRVNNVVLRYMNRDERPAFILDDVHDANFPRWRYFILI